MNKSKEIARVKIKRYNEYIAALKSEKTELEKLVNAKALNEMQTARANQRIFDIDVTIEGHRAFIKAYEERIK